MDPYLCEEDFIQPPAVIIPTCQGCGKPASELPEYISGAEMEEMTPDEYCKSQEGTYNHSNGHFLCSPCYIKAGMPSLPGRRGWKCP